MRLQLASLAVAVWVCLAPGHARAQGDERRVSAGLRIYTDDDHITVVSPSAGAQTPVTETVVVDVNATADIVSGASVDVISEASPGAISEKRIEVGLGAGWRVLRLLELRGRAVLSHEEDYDSARLLLGTGLDLFQKNTRLELEYRAGLDHVGAVTRPDFSARRRGHRLTSTITQIVDRHTYVDLVVEGEITSGYHGNPYRTVPIIDPASTELVRVDEVTPDVRRRGALRGRLRRGFARFFLHADYRFYVDDWGVMSHTATATGIMPVGDRMRIGLRTRAYTQSAADFYQSAYTLEDDGGLPALRTRERRLGTMHSLYGAVIGERALGRGDGDERPRLVLALGFMHFFFPDFAAQSHRNAMAMTVGLTSAL